ncbi:hypothetical protein [Bradyrhizobium sp. JYMT SZCCT0180]|uniref:ATP-dependent DNA ligase n=1 Tax=Bradyrhizobium sp. JYMT SZCCT0180 TaxID=2807666 RepID=UPI002011EBE2|nr:hypothetical protein [Bradyrhizobium sp. JYMT SZCCT0180]
MNHIGPTLSFVARNPPVRAGGLDDRRALVGSGRGRTRVFNALAYLNRMRTSAFEPCIPTRATKVPTSKSWIHEVKHDGYRLIVHREGKRVRLFTRNGHDWSDKYPMITEAALRIRSTSFVLDGEAVLLAIDGISDFDGLHSRKHNDEVQFYAFDMLVSDGMTSGSCR